MLSENVKEKALEMVAAAILKDPRSETTIRSHYQLAINTEDDIQVSIFLHILNKAMKKHQSRGDIEDIIQDEYLEYIIKTSTGTFNDERPKTRQRRYVENVPEGNIPEVCLVLFG